MNPIIFFDGYCNLCNGTVNFIIRNDKKRLFRYAALQSEPGKELLKNMLLIAKPFQSAERITKGKVDSVILIYKNIIYIESDAAVRVAELIGFPWNIVLIFKIVPGKLRDRLYRWIAKNRYRWFGKRDWCRIPTEKEKALFY